MSGGSSDEDPSSAPGEGGRKRSRSGRGAPKRKRRHRLAVVKGGWNEEDDAKLTRSAAVLLHHADSAPAHCQGIAMQSSGSGLTSSLKAAAKAAPTPAA